MRFGNSRAERVGIGAFVALAALLGILLITNTRGGDNETAAQVQSIASLPGTEDPEPTPVPTTAPLSVPEPTPTPSPTPTPLPSPTPTPETDDDAASEADGTADDGGTGDTSTSSAGDSGASTSAPAATAVPNPQPATTAVPNPQPATTAVPNPQPSQPVTGDTGPIDVPVAAPAGGTFTHTLRATVPQPTLYTQPGGSTFMPTFNGTALPPVNPTVFGNALVYRVLAGQPGDAWAQVYVPARPNGTTAWVQTSQFTWGSSNRMIVINISNNTVSVVEGSNTLMTTAAATGKSASRTPLANGWVEEVMPGPSGAYGPLLISLGLFSEDLNSFGGNVPKIALHGNNNASLLGQYVSNGCIRVGNSEIQQIAGMVQVGSKVVITR